MKKEVIIIRKGPKGNFAEVYSVNNNKVKFVKIRKATETDKKKAISWWSQGDA